MSPSPHRLSTQSTQTTASSLSSSSSLSNPSYRPASSSNGRLSPASQRLSVNVPDNTPFIPSLALDVGPNPGGAASNATRPDSYRPASSLSHTWSAREVQAEEDEDEWADADDGEAAGTGQGDAGQATAGRRGEASTGPTTPITLPLQSHDDGEVGERRVHHEDDELDDQVGAAFPSSLGVAGCGLGLGLGVGGASFPRTPSPREERASADSYISSTAVEGEVGEQAQRWGPARLTAPAEEHGESMPFPSSTVPPLRDVPAYSTSPSSSRLIRPSLVSAVSSSRSPRPSTAALSTTASSNSSTLSLPTAPPVDLSLPNVRPGATYVSVADSRMASLAAGNSPLNSRGPHQHSTARTFFSNLLSRSPRSDRNSPRFSPNPSPSSSPNPASPSESLPRSPSAPLGWQYQDPSVSSLQSTNSDGIHSRSTSMPTIAPGNRPSGDSPQGRDTRDLCRAFTGSSEREVPQRRTPRALAAATFAGLTRSTSLGAGRASSHNPSSSPRSSPVRHQAGPTSSPIPTIGFATPPMPSTSAPPPPPPPTLEGIGLSLVPLTPGINLNRNGIPLCGALLDNKYLLIGTTTGLDFLPLALPGSLPMKHHGPRKRKETRKPISLIKRTRFKDLAVLSERSNILLAIAGRNDHIRVYALDGVRSMIEKKMAEVDMRDGYPLIQDASIFDARPLLARGKGKAKATPSPQRPPPSTDSSTTSSLSSRPLSTFPPAAGPPVPGDPSPAYQFPPSSSSGSSYAPPPDYILPAPAPRRRPPSWHQASLVPPASPVRISSRQSSFTSFVRAVPTNPAPSSASPTAPSFPARGSVSSQTTLRPQKSRDFIAGTRKGSTATIQKRRSRGDLRTPPFSSRRNSFASGSTGVDRRGSTRTSDAQPFDGRRGSAPALPSLPGALSAARRPSALSMTSAATAGTSSSSSPFSRPRSRMEPRPPTKPQNPLERSPTSDLADFLRQSGPEMRSPEMDRVLVQTRERRRSSVAERLVQVAGVGGAQQFPASSSSSSAATFPPSSNGQARPSLARAVSTGAAQMTGLALYAPGKDGKDDLVKMLQATAGPIDREGRRASMNDVSSQGVAARRNSGTTHNNGNGGSKHLARDARTPRLTATDRSPALELAELLRDTSLPAISAAPIFAESFPATSTSRNRPCPRDATTPRLGLGQQSPAMELATLLRETGPLDVADGVSPESSPKQSSPDPFATTRPSPPSSAGALQKGKAPESRRISVGHGSRLVPRSPFVDGADESTEESTDGEPSSQQQQHQRWKQSLTLAEAIRAGPEPSTSSSSLGAPSTGLGISNSPGGGVGGSPNSRSSKRWTMSGVGSKFLSRPRSNSPTSLQPTSPRHSSAASQRPSQDSREISPWEMVPEMRDQRATVTGQEGRPGQNQQQQGRGALLPAATVSSTRDEADEGDLKRRPTTSFNGERAEVPHLPAGSQSPPDAHPANSSSPLEYVKLARTKGARLLRAVETKKRTYLAVLCGEDGERIELFTGSRSISLSLNRTFVLPETPRTIEFQLQGDDLVDIYLVYGESIFALEPATVRVREVGIGRGERRARRERERRMRNVAATTRAPPADDPAAAAAADDVHSPALHSALHPADPTLQEEPSAEESQPENEDATVAIVDAAAESSTASPTPRLRSLSTASRATAPPPFPEGDFPAAGPDGPPPHSAASVSTTGDVHARASSSRPSKPTVPYSSFQQLPFVPPVPSAVLSSAWTIPPLYSDVIAGSPIPPYLDPDLQPSISVTGAAGGMLGDEMPTPDLRPGADLPLLSPISLLGGAALRQNDPPGLFFVSKGKNISGIVTADGKSIIKRPLVWSHEKSDPSEPPSESQQRIEVLVVGGKKTVVVKVGTTDVKAISVDGVSTTSPFSPALLVSPSSSSSSSPQNRSNIQFLATHTPGQQLLFAQSVGTSYTVQCLGAR
ncbi:hypothetical protein JCM11641_007555 [Rhodosporidiobolus odoratus]